MSSSFPSTARILFRTVGAIYPASWRENTRGNRENRGGVGLRSFYILRTTSDVRGRDRGGRRAKEVCAVPTDPAAEGSPNRSERPGGHPRTAAAFEPRSRAWFQVPRRRHRAAGRYALGPRPDGDPEATWRLAGNRPGAGVTHWWHGDCAGRGRPAQRRRGPGGRGSSGLGRPDIERGDRDGRSTRTSVYPSTPASSAARGRRRSWSPAARLGRRARTLVAALVRAGDRLISPDLYRGCTTPRAGCTRKTRGRLTARPGPRDARPVLRPATRSPPAHPPDAPRLDGRHGSPAFAYHPGGWRAGRPASRRGQASARSDRTPPCSPARRAPPRFAAVAGAVDRPRRRRRRRHPAATRDHRRAAPAGPDGGPPLSRWSGREARAARRPEVRQEARAAKPRVLERSSGTTGVHAPRTDEDVISGIRALLPPFPSAGHQACRRDVFLG
jgi:hypothetical protein